VTTPNNLPAELTSFVGREPQLAELRRLLRKSRLITLTGPGGAGKTRLALKLAFSVLDRYRDGVWLVELATLNDKRLLEQTVAVACGIRETQRRPFLESLVEGLSGRQVLLLLDSCEHLVESCAELVIHLLRSCPKLTVVVTSREPLGVPGELVWRTPSLSLPRAEDGAQPELVVQSEAVRLFVDRARLNRPAFELESPAAAAAVAQICSRLEGMPLAIELAAGLARVMTLEEIRERLRDRFRLLTGGSRSALPRHQTLRQAVDWSYGLLSPAERHLLARLAVFSGGFDMAAAEAVGLAGAGVPGGVMELVQRLVDKSLVSADAAGGRSTRFRMLDTIREYALEKLQEGDEAEARRLHARYFLEWTAQAARGLRSAEHLDWLRRLDDEQANIRLALSWSMIEEPEAALRLAAAMGAYWHVRRRLVEGLEWLDQALDLEAPKLDVRAAALWSRSRIRWRHGDYDEARRDAEECAALSRELNLPLELSGALTMLGLLTNAAGDTRAGMEAHEEALRVSRQNGDHEGVARSLNNIALIVSYGGDHARAKAILEQALSELSASPRSPIEPAIVDSHARVMFLMKDYEGARAEYEKAIEIEARYGDALTLADSLEGLAVLAMEEGDSAHGIRLLSAATTLRVVTGGQPLPPWGEMVQDTLQAGRSKLGAQAAEAAWQQGVAMTMQEAARYALGAPSTPPAAGRTNGSPLTGRESQVASLIADGLTNGEIAKRLRMAERTADAHVEHIRNKLGLRSRSQIAVWAHERLGKH
jgi:predicted ATPase/DNA-binding CsgD family transcriptional regulator